MMVDGYRRPGRITRAFNSVVAGCARLGVSVWGSRILETRGRRSGVPRHTPVNVLTLDGASYLVSPRGQTEWVRNLRAADGRIALLLGRTRTEYAASELIGDDRLPVLRAYLRRWKLEVGVFFSGVSDKSSDAELAAIADDHPVFLLGPVDR